LPPCVCPHSPRVPQVHRGPPRVAHARADGTPMDEPGKKAASAGARAQENREEHRPYSPFETGPPPPRPLPLPTPEPCPHPRTPLLPRATGTTADAPQTATQTARRQPSGDERYVRASPIHFSSRLHQPTDPLPPRCPQNAPRAPAPPSGRHPLPLLLRERKHTHGDT
jgi:hypothetical protein